MLRKFSFAVALTAAVMFSPAAIAGKSHGEHGHGGHGHSEHGHSIIDISRMFTATRIGTIIGTTPQDGHGRYWAVVGTDME